MGKLFSLGHKIIHIPTLKISSIKIEPIDASKYHAYIFTSANAIRNLKVVKQDKSKLAQLLLYKYFYSEKYDVDMGDVDVEYFILKRKLWENVDFPQKRIQIFKPANGKVSINRVKGELFNFIEKVFDEQGNYLTSDHDATPSKDSCRWCEFNQTKHCDKGIR